MVVTGSRQAACEVSLCLRERGPDVRNRPALSHLESFSSVSMSSASVTRLASKSGMLISHLEARPGVLSSYVPQISGAISSEFLSGPSLAIVGFGLDELERLGLPGA
jgi:hypothetical protein